MKKIIFLLSVLLVLYSQDINFIVKPTSSYNQTTASPQACYADCQSCQTRTNQCQECLSPYFIKADDGSCQLVDTYTLQSVVNELYFGNAFVPADLSWSVNRTTICQPGPQFLTAPLKILGPYSPGVTVTYRRSVAFHQYIVIKFQLIKMNWDASSLLTINIYDQNFNLLTSRVIGDSPNVPKQRLCSGGIADQRLSVLFQLNDNKVSTLYMNYTFVSNSQQSSWGIATFVLITGFCDFSCTKCRYSSDEKDCINCNYFLMTGTDGKCSQCYRGFKFINENGFKLCRKCEIQFEVCTPGQELCHYRYLEDEVYNNNCTFKAGRDLSSVYDADLIKFSGSLMTINGKPSIYQCGQYSFIGLAQQGDYITRIFNLKPHFFISISFNIFVIDQETNLKTNLFVIIIDNIILEATYVNTETISNACGNDKLQAFVTYSPTKFYPHTKENNTNISITSNAVNWGIRNLRISYRICDSSCINCGSNGCQECNEYFQLNNLKCASCLIGYGIVLNANETLNTCVQCPQNCLTCSIDARNSSIINCTSCSTPFFLFENGCKLKTNVGNIIPINPLSSSNISTPLNTWTQSSDSELVRNLTCSVNLSSSANRNLNFTVANNKLKSIVMIPEVHYKKIIEFYLVKIDKWNKNDRLDLYLNDLLIFSKTFTEFGNKVCSNASQLDFISFQTLQFFDTNNTLTVFFEVVSQTNSRRLFGIDKFKVYPVGCESCNNYPFNYQLKYNYDNGLNIHVEFNRIYINTNQTLFKSIFELYINTLKLNYNIRSNNSVTYILEVFPPNEKLTTNITLVCRYPQLVQTETNNQINKNPFFTVRELQASRNYQVLKIVDNNQSDITITRYNPIDNLGAIDGIRIFFQVVSRIVIYLGFAFFFIGCQTSCTHFMHNLQKLWLHIFIASLTIPSALKYTLVGFRETQNQNIAINPSDWQSSLPKALYYDTPAYFQSYYTDVGFFRNIYNIAIAFLILAVVSIIFHFVFKLKSIGKSQNSGVFWRHMRITFVKRPFFVFNSIVFYQYLTLVLACTLQFTGFNNETNQGSYGGISSAAAIVTFIIATLYPLIQFYYLRNRWIQQYKDRKIQYYNRYHEIFFRFVPMDIWIQNSAGLTYSQRLYNLFRFGQIWWLCLLATIFYGSPNAQCFLLFITNTLHLTIVLFSDMSYSIYFKIFKFLELAFFVGLEIIILVCYSQRETLTNKGYNTLGSVGIALIFAIILFSFMRFIYTFWKIYSEYNVGRQISKYANIKTRNEDYFSEIELSYKE